MAKAAILSGFLVHDSLYPAPRFSLGSQFPDSGSVLRYIILASARTTELRAQLLDNSLLLFFGVFFFGGFFFLPGPLCGVSLLLSPGYRFCATPIRNIKLATRGSECSPSNAGAVFR